MPRPLFCTVRITTAFIYSHTGKELKNSGALQDYHVEPPFDELLVEKTPKRKRADTLSSDSNMVE